MHGRCELLGVHQEVAIAGDGESQPPGRYGRCNASGNAVAHGTTGRRKLCLEALGQSVVAIKAMQPGSKVASTIGQHRIRRQMLFKGRHDGGHVDSTGQGLRLQVAEVVSVAGLRPRLPWHGRRCRHIEQAQCRDIHAGIDRQISLVNAVEFFRAGVDVHQFLFWPWHVEQGVGAAGHLAQPRANSEDQITASDTRCQLGVDCYADIAGVERVVVVKRVLKAKRIAHRQRPALGKALQGLRRCCCPAAATGNHKRLFGLQQQPVQTLQCRCPNRGFQR